MKRIIPFLLILALIFVQLPSLFALEVHAADTQIESGFMNLMDYDYPVGHASFTYQCWTPTNCTFTFNLPSSTILTYVDIVYSCGLGSLGVYPDASYSNSYGTFSLKTVHIGGSYYRVFGYLNGDRRNTFLLNMNFKQADWLTFISINVTSSPVFSDYVPVTMSGMLNDSTPITTRTYSSSSGPVISYLTGTVASTPFNVYYEISPADYNPYDFIEIKGVFEVGQLSSIAAWIGNDIIPFEVNYLNDPGIDLNYFFISIILDLRNIKRTESANLNISILGNVYSGTNSFSIMSSVGYISIPDDNPYIYYFKKVISTMSDGNGNIISSIREAADKIASAFSSGLASSGEGQVIKDKGSQIGGEISAGQAQLDAVNKPSGGDISAVDSLGAVGFTGNTTYLTQIVNTPYIKDVFVFVAILAVVSLVLFGSKKGG